MRVLFKLVAIFTIFTSSFLSLASAETIANRSECYRFYNPIKVYEFGRRDWHRPEPKVIGDSVEPKYKPREGFVKELKETEVSNQCDTSECYLFAVINFINVFNKNQKNIEAPLVSEAFLVAHKFLQHIEEAVSLGTESPKLVHDLEGGFAFEAIHLTRKVGLMPQEAFTATKPFDQWDTREIYKKLGKGVPEAHKEIRKLAKEFGWKSPQVIEHRAKKVAELQEIILKYSGPLPTQFTYRGENFTPQTFERRFGVPRLDPFYAHDMELYELPDNMHPVMKETFTNEGGRYEIIKANKDNLLYSMRTYIDRGLPTIMDLNWRDDGHSMLVVGYEFNETNEIVRFKVMNSWGSSFANNGYAWYTPEDVWKNVTGTYRVDKQAN